MIFYVLQNEWHNNLIRLNCIRLEFAYFFEIFSAVYFSNKRNYAEFYCSILGSVFVTGGLYAFLWGKSKESTLEATSQKNDDQHSSEAMNSEPLGGSISSRSETALNVNEEARAEHKNGEALGSNGDGEVL